MEHRIGQPVRDLAYHSSLNPSAKDFLWVDKTGTEWKWSPKMKLWTYYSHEFKLWTGIMPPPPERGPYRCTKRLRPLRRW